MKPPVFWCERALVDGVVHDRVAVSVTDGRIAAVEVDVDPAAGVHQLHGVVVPGLANAHSHAFHRALRSRTQTGSGSFWTWRDQMYRAAGRLDPDRYHALARATFAEMAQAGITVVGEFHYLHHQPDGTPYAQANAMGEALLSAASAAGIRMTLLDTLYLHGGLDGDGYRPVEDHQRAFTDGSFERWAERMGRLSPGPGQQIGVAAHSVRAVDPDALASLAAWVQHHDAVVHAHVSEQPAENDACATRHGRTPTEVLHDAGLLDARFTAVHATHLRPLDAHRLGQADAGVCLCPTTERDLADGIGPTARLREVGARLCLGTDSHAVIDLFEEARAVELDERLASGRRGTHRADDLLAMACVHGHRALGWDDAGEIRPGARADLVAVRLDSVRTAGTTTDTALPAVIFAAGAADVSDVVVDGRVVVADGAHVGIDVAAELGRSIAEVMDG